MTIKHKARIEYLGQSGLKIDVGSITVLIDPYLSHSVQQLDSQDMVRQVPIPYDPYTLTSIDWILITHEHMDHCDPHTIPALAQASPQAQFIAPLAVQNKLKDWGVKKDRIHQTPLNVHDLGCGLYVQALPSAHPTIRFDQAGMPQAVGYLFNYEGRYLYSAGDTSVCDELLNILREVPQIDIALLPVNENNYFRRRRGIIGNMSVREAFGLAAEIGVQNLVPVHCDMFVANSTSQEEISAIYKSYSWPFKLLSADFIEL